MSWIDDIKNDLIITTGDGKKYKPTWINPKKTLEWNISEFTFPNVPGTRVDRRELIGRKFPLEIYFQGDDHLANHKDFEESCKNKNYWKLDHPLYDTILCHPVSLEFDNTVMNITRISGMLIETITDDKPVTTITAIDAIRISKVNLDSSFEKSITVPLSVQDVTSIKNTNKKNYNLSVPIIKQPTEFENYNYAFNQANSFVNTATASPILAMRYTMRAITMPATFANSVTLRMNLLNNQYLSLRQTLNNLFAPSSKQTYQLMAGSIISSMCLAASLPQDADYLYATTVVNVMDVISGAYNNFLLDLDTLQSANGGQPDSFIADSDSIILLQQLVFLTVSNLFNISLGAKQQKIFYAEHDTNIIILAHRFYGLDDSDSNLDEFIANNNFSMQELIQIKKGTQIVYYI